MRVGTVAAGLVVAVSLSSACNSFQHRQPKVEAPSQQTALQGKLLSDGKKDSSTADIFSLPAPVKK